MFGLKTRDTNMVPSNMLTRMRDEMDRVFDRFVRDPLDFAWSGDGKNWMPALDVVDTENELVIRAELPGIAAKDVNVSVTGNVLTLSGQKEETKEEKSSNWCMSERRFGSFQRSIQLSDGLDVDKINAEQDNGVLTVKIPKLRSARPKQIQVKPAAKG